MFALYFIKLLVFNTDDFLQAIVFMLLMGISLAFLYIVSFVWLRTLVERYNRSRQVPNLAERDFIREHRGEFQRQRELQRKLELERKRELNRRAGDDSLGSEEVTNVYSIFLVFIYPTLQSTI